MAGILSLRLAWIALLAWQLLWHAGLPAPLGSRLIWLGLFSALPLVMMSFGVWKAQSRMLFWSMFLVMAYFVVAVMEAWSNPPQRLAAITQVVLCLGYFAALMRFSQLKRRV